MSIMPGITAPALLRYIADGGSRHTPYPQMRDEGWVLVDHFKAAPIAQIKLGSVKEELRQMAKRGTVEVHIVSTDTTRVRLTQQGLDYILESRRA